MEAARRLENAAGAHCTRARLSALAQSRRCSISRNASNVHLFKNTAGVLANDGKNLAQNIQNRQLLHYPHIMMQKLTNRG
jgi:hypothetical protein